MILYEFEGKQLLAQAGIKVPQSQLIDKKDSGRARMTIEFPLVLKAQVLSGKRAQAGGIMVVDVEGDLQKSLEEMFGKVINKERVEKVLVEEKVDFEQEYYLSLSYDTDYHQPVLTISAQGGTGIEERQVKTFPIDPLTQTVILVSEQSECTQNQTKDSGVGRQRRPPQNDIPQELIQKLINLFFGQDCLLLEINPLVKVKSSPSTTSTSLSTSSLGTKSSRVWMALDAKVKLDDTAFKRHEDWQFSPRSVPGYSPSKREIEAKKIDEADYRGTAGSAYFDLEGDIAVLASGGGASLTAMDALLKAGGKPANYTEYSGNPPKKKVTKLTKIVLSKPNLHGLWVVGAVANFTDIYETLSGFIEGLRQAQQELGTKFTLPIVIRRGGPRDQEAFVMLREVKDFDLHLYGEETSITESAKIMAELAEKYKMS